MNPTIHDIFLKCRSCDKEFVITAASAATKINCQVCGHGQEVPALSVPQSCPHCNQAVKIDLALQGVVLRCRSCKKAILLPMLRSGRIFCLCKRCEKKIELPASEAGKLVACPQCDGWICCPALTEVVNASPISTPTAVTTSATTGERRSVATPLDSEQTVLQHLEDEARQLASHECFRLAMLLLKYYDGRYAEETKAVRLQLAQKYLEMANQHSIPESPKSL